jgi:N-acetyl-gamma-glutamyl-phosphate reductase
MSQNQIKIKVGIQGASGYTGGELIRLILKHPNCELIYAGSESNYGRLICDIHQDLVGECEIKFTNKLSQNIDVLFLCLGHGYSESFLRKIKLDKKIKIIDLSQDFRLEKRFKERTFNYGLPELQKEKISKSSNIANPGCFATAIQLGLLPIISSDYEIDEVHTNAITGSTGAGVKLNDTSHFSWRNNNISWYKPFKHQHLNEVNNNFCKIYSKNVKINFIPIRGNFTRGIFCTSYFKNELSLKNAENLYQEFYRQDPFTIISKNEIHLKQVINTNKCLIHLRKENDILLVTSVIDNLVKGASGQALQNMNLMFGIDETTGLKLKSSIF